MLVLSFTCTLVSQARPNQCQRGSDTDWSNPCWRWLGLQLARLPCLYASVHRWPAFMPFRLLVNHSACFQAVWPAFKPFGPVSKRDHFALYIESGPTSLKMGWPVYKPVARLQTGQVCNRFATYVLQSHEKAPMGRAPSLPKRRVGAFSCVFAIN